MRRLFFLGVFGMILTTVAAAHPHVWIDQAVQLEVEKGRLQGLWVEWTFDEMMTATVTTDFPLPSGGRYPAPTQANIRKGYFDNLQNFHFFSYLWFNGRSMEVPRPQNFSIWVDKNRMTYRFFLPLNLVVAKASEFVVSLYDETFFTDMGFKKSWDMKPLGAGLQVRASLRQNKARAYYGGQVFPEEVVYTLLPTG